MRGRKRCFCAFGAKGVDHRADHADAESDQFRRIAALRLVEKDRLLDRAPSGAAPFLRPVRGAPALGGENARPAHIVVLGQVPAGDRLLADRGRQVVAHKGANLGAKLKLVLGQSKVHGDRLPDDSAPDAGLGAGFAPCRPMSGLGPAPSTHSTGSSKPAGRRPGQDMTRDSLLAAGRARTRPIARDPGGI